VEKTIHQIWLGPKPFPEKFKPWQESWQIHFPDWKYKLWTDDEVEALMPEMISADIFSRASNFGMKSDLLRLEILRLHGGMYFDADFECFRRFDFLPADCFCYADERSHRPGNAFLAAPKGHPFLAAALTGFCNALSTPGAFDRDPVKATGPEALHRALQPWGDPWVISDEILDRDDSHIGSRVGSIAYFKTRVFYPYDWSDAAKARWKASLTRGTTATDYPHAYAAHHWEKSWK